MKIFEKTSFLVLWWDLLADLRLFEAGDELGKAEARAHGADFWRKNSFFSHRCSFLLISNSLSCVSSHVAPSSTLLLTLIPDNNRFNQ